MKKLEDIPKKNIFQVPEGYFDELPGRVQARIPAGNVNRATSWSWTTALRYALPSLVAVALFAGWWLKNDAPEEDAEAILASIETEQLAAYLEEYELIGDDLILYDELTEEDAAAIEDEVYEATFDEEYFEQLLEEFPDTVEE